MEIINSSEILGDSYLTSATSVNLFCIPAELENTVVCSREERDEVLPRPDV
jgi:hypothetical protein